MTRQKKKKHHLSFNRSSPGQGLKERDGGERSGGRRRDLGSGGGSPRSRAPPRHGPPRVGPDMRGDLPTKRTWSGCRERGTSPQPPALGGALARTGANPAPGFHPGLAPGQNAGGAISAPGPAPGPRPAANRTHPRRPSDSPRHPEGPGRASLTCTANQSATPRAPEAAAGLAPARSTRSLSGRLCAASSRRRSPTGGGGGGWAAGGG